MVSCNRFIFVYRYWKFSCSRNSVYWAAAVKVVTSRAILHKLFVYFLKLRFWLSRKFTTSILYFWLLQIKQFSLIGSCCHWFERACVQFWRWLITLQFLSTSLYRDIWQEIIQTLRLAIGYTNNLVEVYYYMNELSSHLMICPSVQDQKFVWSVGMHVSHGLEVYDPTLFAWRWGVTFPGGKPCVTLECPSLMG